MIHTIYRVMHGRAYASGCPGRGAHVVFVRTQMFESGSATDPPLLLCRSPRRAVFSVLLSARSHPID